jgi:hypothetical protein
MYKAVSFIELHLALLPSCIFPFSLIKILCSAVELSDMRTLLSPDFYLKPTSHEDVQVTTFVFGFTLGFAVLTAWKAVQQTVKIWQRTKKIASFYTMMIMLELVVNIAMSTTCWMGMIGAITPR